jgi:cell division protein FtsB
MAAVHTTGINLEQWAVIAVPVLTLVSWLGKRITAKVDAVGEHLKRQDAATQKISERVARLEGPIRQFTNGSS